MKKVIFLSITIFLSACAGNASVPMNSSLEAGKYYVGDGLGVNISVLLNNDGSYTAEWNGCLGNYGNSRGQWKVEG